MLANAWRIYDFLKDKPGWGIDIFRSRGGNAGEWVITVTEPSTRTANYITDSALRFHVHVDEDTSFDTALEIAENYILGRLKDGNG